MNGLKECPKCHGTGRSNTILPIPCDRCHGDKFVENTPEKSYSLLLTCIIILIFILILTAYIRYEYVKITHYTL